MSEQTDVNEGGKELPEQSGLRCGGLVSNRRVRLLAGLIIAVCAVVVVVHRPALSTRALSFDDGQYLTNNLLVQYPSLGSAWRFLTEILEPSTVEGYYQPLTMISLMVDHALGGRADNLRPFHRTSLALHAANTGLIIVLLYLLFGQAWIAAGVGLLFGVHPMTVEPIPWIGERKTLLTAFFVLWCLILYVYYARKNDRKFYTGCLVMYILALMSKPTALPVPVLMLVLDYWPLRRWRRQQCLEEKLPFFVVGGASALITYISQSRTAMALLPGAYSLNRIILTLCHNIIFYPYKMVWPANLSSHYTFPTPMGLSHPMVLAGVVGTCILIHLLVTSLRRTPALVGGWLFFFLAILPTMQIIGFSNVIASDKFAYLPSLGLLMVLASFLGWFCGVGKAARRRVAVLIVVLVLAGAESVVTRRHLAHWRDTVSFYKHMLRLTPDAIPLHIGMGVALVEEGRLDEAISHYRRALQISPDLANAHNDLGNTLLAQGKSDEAIRHYHQALQLDPNYADAHSNLAAALAKRGKFDEAIEHYRQALETEPGYLIALNSIAHILATHPDPNMRDAEEAVHFAERSAGLTRHRIASFLNTLATSYAAAGEFEQAISTAEEALELAVAREDSELANQIRERLELYKQEKPYLEPLQE